jgi:hypothetical protein
MLMARSSLRFLFSINSKVVLRFGHSDAAVRSSALKTAVFHTHSRIGDPVRLSTIPIGIAQVD